MYRVASLEDLGEVAAELLNLAVADAGVEDLFQDGHLLGANELSVVLQSLRRDHLSRVSGHLLGLRRFGLSALCDGLPRLRHATVPDVSRRRTVSL